MKTNSSGRGKEQISIEHGSRTFSLIPRGGRTIAELDGKKISPKAYYSMRSKIPHLVKCALYGEELTIDEIAKYVKRNLLSLAETKDEKRISSFFDAPDIRNILDGYMQKGIVIECIKIEMSGGSAYSHKTFKLTES